MSRLSLAAHRQLEIVEGTLKSATFRGGAHDADLSGGRRYQVAKAHRSKILAIGGTKSFQRIGPANHSPPNRPAGYKIAHGGPVGEFAGEDHAGVTSIIREFRPALHPVPRIDANHQPSLVILRRVLPLDASLENAIASDRQMKEVPAIGDVSKKCLPPEIRLRLRSHDEFDF